MGTLYVVGTPIGNREDITLRALRILREVALIAAEDTRKTRNLLAAHGIKRPLTSYHEANKRAKLPQLMRHLEEHDLAVVSEAGMPGLSDPGFELISGAIVRGCTVTPIPGPSAALAALVVSGLPVHQFTYLGFLPRSRGERRRELSSVAGDGRTLVAFEAPHRVRESLQDIVEIMGNRRIAVCREMTKLHEEIFRGTVEEALGRFSQPRGEFTVVIAGRERARGSDGVSQALQDEVESLCGQGMRLKEAVAFVAGASGVSRRLLYDTCIKDRSKS